ncbi:MAG: leucine--tRNA ligase [Candidatus Marinimicrobia bacterium]|nr:leucine--tRNA ligase [Candidatus Neomarinimicrobiota bacterium]
MAKHYHPEEIEKKWQKKWREKDVFEVDLEKAKKPFFNLMMFPYPSGEGLHVGNMYAFTGSDLYGRYQRMKGFDVFEPIGLDGFGIHSENYAIKLGKHPAEVAKKTEKNFYCQLEATGNAYAWQNTLETYHPDYYHWTQWLFLQLYKKGLVERRKASVNWCPSCKTTLSDEQVIAGKCERCDNEVKKKELEQWFFKITQYTERLLKNLDRINWSERTKTAQKNWIGKSEGAELQFSISGSQEKIATFTTRPDTIFGATFFILAPESEWVEKLTSPENKEKVSKYIEKSRKKTEIQRLFTEREKTGVFTGGYVVNPATEKKIPVWVADYVVMGYGTGAVMGVPAHDQRDWEFAKKYQLPIVEVISGGEIKKEAHDGQGKLVNSGEFSGLTVEEGIKKITAWLKKKGLAKKQTQYRLRDWCVSRQRYWGPPIPMIHCSKCGWQPVPEKDLPVKLPNLENWKPLGTGVSPLAQAQDWVKVKCPQCHGPAERETDVSDTFLDSAWYFFRYTSTDKKRVAFDQTRVKKWLPVEMYIGGQEHAVLHLMYTRFLTMVLKDLGLIDFEEPFERFYAHGLLIKDGAKMSKSKGNVVIPDDYVQKFGADSLRCYLMFLGPFDQGGDFRDRGIAGLYRFLGRVWRICQQFGQEGSLEEKRVIHRTIKIVTEDIENLRYNTALAALMEYVNYLYQEKKVSREAIETLVLLFAPFAPHISEEIWVEVLKNKFSIHQNSWPKYEEKLIKEEKVMMIIQVNGKLRGQREMARDQAFQQSAVENMAKKEANVAKYLEKKKIKKVVFVSGKLINFVV